MRDMSATGRYAPQPRHAPFAFYSAVRLGDPDQLALIMKTDPYFITQDNGAGAPLHFATTFRQLDMMHHLLNMGAEVNQRDQKGWTPLHRAAYLAHYNGYIELYEYLLSRGADPSIRTEDYEPYLNPGKKTVLEVAPEEDFVRNRLIALNAKYESTPKKREPHPDVGCWWALYDYGPAAVQSWGRDYVHPYPEVAWREASEKERKALRRARRAEKAAKGNGAKSIDPLPATTVASVPETSKVPASSAAAGQEARPAVPQSQIAFLFPGQGSQAVGMLQAAKDIPKVAAMLQTAQKVLGYDLLQLCLEGPKEKLDETQYAQPALYVAGLAAVELLRKDDASTVDNCSATAGLSLGEYTALVFAGALSLEDGLKVVKVRGESMAAAAKLGEPHGMLSVIGLSDEALEGIIADLRKSGTIPPASVCQLANYLFPQGRVISGHLAALDAVTAAVVKAGALKAVRLAVSGAFHTPLMQPARDALVKVLAEVTVKNPRIPVYSNVTAAPLESAQQVQELLARQLVEPVQWEGTLTALTAAGKSQMYELGPGSQIKAMMKRIDNPIWKAFKNISS